METKFGFGKPVDSDFDDTIDRVTQALEAEGFGVLAEIDVAAKLREKLGAKMGQYRILGACNPSLAQKAIQAVPEIGLLLPCNVLVREIGDGKVHVSFMDPSSVLSLVDHPDVEGLAAEIRERLQRACDTL